MSEAEHRKFEKTLLILQKQFKREEETGYEMPHDFVLGRLTVLVNQMLDKAISAERARLREALPETGCVACEHDDKGVEHTHACKLMSQVEALLTNKE